VLANIPGASGEPYEGAEGVVTESCGYGYGWIWIVVFFIFLVSALFLWGYLDFNSSQEWGAERTRLEDERRDRDNEIRRLQKEVRETRPDCSDKDREIEELEQRLVEREALYEELMRDGVVDREQAQELEEVRARMQTTAAETARANKRFRDIRGQLQEIFEVTVEVQNAVGPVQAQPLETPEVSDVIATLQQLPQVMERIARTQNQVEHLEAQLQEDSPDLKRIRRAFTELDEQAQQAAIDLGHDPESVPTATSFIEQAVREIQQLRDLHTNRNLKPEQTSLINSYRNQATTAQWKTESLQKENEYLHRELLNATNASQQPQPQPQPQAAPAPSPAPDAHKERQVSVLLRARIVLSGMVKLIQRYTTPEEMPESTIDCPLCGSHECPIDWILQYSQIELHMLPRSVLNHLITQVMEIVVEMHLAMFELEDLPLTCEFGKRTRNDLRAEALAVRAEATAVQENQRPPSPAPSPPASPGKTFKVPSESGSESKSDSDSDSDFDAESDSTDDMPGPGGGSNGPSNPPGPKPHPWGDQDDLYEDDGKSPHIRTRGPTGVPPPGHTTAEEVPDEYDNVGGDGVDDTSHILTPAEVDAADNVYPNGMGWEPNDQDGTQMTGALNPDDLKPKSDSQPKPVPQPKLPQPKPSPEPKPAPQPKPVPYSPREQKDFAPKPKEKPVQAAPPFKIKPLFPDKSPASQPPGAFPSDEVKPTKSPTKQIDYPLQNLSRKEIPSRDIEKALPRKFYVSKDDSEEALRVQQLYYQFNKKGGYLPSSKLSFNLPLVLNGDDGIVPDMHGLTPEQVKELSDALEEIWTKGRTIDGGKFGELPRRPYAAPPGGSHTLFVSSSEVHEVPETGAQNPAEDAKATPHGLSAQEVEQRKKDFDEIEKTWFMDKDHRMNVHRVQQLSYEVARHGGQISNLPFEFECNMVNYEGVDIPEMGNVAPKYVRALLAALERVWVEHK